MPKAAKIYLAILGGMALCLLAWYGRLVHRDEWLLVVSISPVLVLSGLLSNRLKSSRTNVVFSFDSMLTVLALLIGGLGAALWMAAIASFAIDLLQRKPAAKLAYNVSSSALTVAMSGWVFQMLGGIPGTGFQQPLAGLACAVTYMAVNMLLLTQLFRLLTGRPWSILLREAFSPQLHLLYMAGQITGVIGAFLFHDRNAPLWLALMVGQILLYEVAVRQYLGLLDSATRRGDELEAVLSATKSAILVADESDAIRHANPPFLMLTEHPGLPADLLGRSLSSLADFPKVRLLLSKAGLVPSESARTGVVMDAPTGPWRWLDYFRGTVQGSGGHGDGVIHVFTDITPLKEAEQELRRVHESLLITITSLIDARDPYTWGHSSRVAEYARLLARQLDLPDSDCQRIYYAGLLHDIGKVGVEDSILRKTGPLTDEEFAQMKTHPALGDELLRKAGVFTEMLPGVRHHHERIDGRGYPDRIRGEQISLDARILCVADSFDAMTSDRPYRKGMAMEEALRRVVEGSGSQFDPQVVEAFAAAFAAGEIAAARSRATAPPLDLSLSDAAAAQQTGAISVSA